MDINRMLSEDCTEERDCVSLITSIHLFLLLFLLPEDTDKKEKKKKTITLLQCISKSVLPMFSSRSFMVLGLCFYGYRSYI